VFGGGSLLEFGQSAATRLHSRWPWNGDQGCRGRRREIGVRGLRRSYARLRSGESSCVLCRKREGFSSLRTDPGGRQGREAGRRERRVDRRRLESTALALAGSTHGTANCRASASPSGEQHVFQHVAVSIWEVCREISSST